MNSLSVRASPAAACLLLLATTAGSAQTAELLANVHVVLTEGPVAHPDGTVYFTDLANDRILRLGPDGLVSTYRQPANRPNGLRLDAQFRLLAAERGDAERGSPGRITRTDLETGDIEVLADSSGAVDIGVPNDLTFDARGRIYFTGSGEVYRRGADGMGIDVEGNIYVATGMNQTRDTITNLAFGGPDMQTMYVTSGNTVFRVATNIAGTRR